MHMELHKHGWFQQARHGGSATTKAEGLGWRQELASDGGERIVVDQPVLEGLEDVEEEEDGLTCMVCRVGYSLRPTDLLGVYTYNKRVNLGVGTSGSARGDCVYTTVSHFNIIHYQCHQEAKRAARFATGASFSTDSRGGGKESNSKFLPVMIHRTISFTGLSLSLYID